MSHNHGVVTIQAGMYANFVGTHWWNMQEASFCYEKDQAALLDMNHDVLFREGLNDRHETTFTPRLLCIDLKENFRGTRGRDLYDEPSEGEIPKKLMNINSGVAGHSLNTERVMKHPAKYERSPEPDHGKLWDGRFEVKTVPSSTESPESLNCSADQDIQQTAQQSFSSTTEIYNPEKVNVEKLSSAKSAAGICWCHLHNDLPEPKLHLAPLSWSQFMNTNWHPKSPCIVEEYSLNDSSNPLDVYGSGIQSYSSEDSRNNIEDKLRWYAEECDYLQGFQVLVDGYSGFAGITDCILQHLDDEYQKRSIFCFPVFQNTHPLHSQDTVKKMYMLRLYSTLLGFSSFNNYSSIFSPLTVNKDLLSFDTPYTFFPYTHLNPQLLYHSSAVLAAAMESVTSPYRLKSRQFLMSDVAKNMSLFGRKLLSTNICFPFPLSASIPFKDMVSSNEKFEWSPSSLTPFSDPLHHKILSQFAVLRGVPESMMNSSKISPCNKVSAEDLFYQYMQKYTPSSVLSMSVFDEKCKVTPPFPNFFCLRLNSNGNITDHERAYTTGIKNIPVASFLCNSNGTSDLLCKLLNQAEKLNLKSYAKHEDPFVETDDFNEAIQSLHCLKECYGHSYS